MSLYIPKKVVLNWYKYDISFSLELIDSFVQGIEAQVVKSIARFGEVKESFVLEEIPEEGIARVVEVHQGLDDETWDLNSIFRNHFPNLQRRSALLTLTGYFEHELDKLCQQFQVEKAFSLSLSDLAGSGIARSTNYLEKVAGIDAHKTSREWNQIKNIQKVRNLIVHQDGQLIDSRGEPNKAVIEYIRLTESLEGDDEVIVKSNYLAQVSSIYRAYFKLIDESILSKEND